MGMSVVVAVCFVCVFLCLYISFKVPTRAKKLSYELLLEEGDWRYAEKTPTVFESIEFLFDKLYVKSEEKSGILVNANNSYCIYEQYVQCSHQVNNIVILYKFENSYISSPMFISNNFLPKLSGFKKYKNKYNIFAVSIEKAQYEISQEILEILTDIEDCIENKLFIVVLNNNTIGLLVQYSDAQLLDVQCLHNLMENLQHISRNLYESV